MKKGLFIVVLLMATLAAKAVGFTYDAGAELTSAYLWRGQYNGGLSFQPTLAVGFEGNIIAFKAGAWGNIGASDWMFRKGLPIETVDGEELDPNTRFMPEVDLSLELRIFGAGIGLNHYYYCDGSNFFSWQSDERILEEGNTSTTEIWVGYDFDHELNVGAYINWYVTFIGNDFNYNAEKDEYKRAWSSYIELGYEHTFESIDFTIGGELGISPWRSELYGNEHFAVTNLSLRVEKGFEVGPCTLSVFAQGMLNPNGINSENAYIKNSGDFKLYKQKLNGCIGLGVWF